MGVNFEKITLLEKLLSDKSSISREELAELRLFFSSEEGKAEVEEWLLGCWQRPPSGSLSVDFDLLYRKIERRMAKKPLARSHAVSTLTRCAAALFIPLLGGFVALLLLKQRPVVLLSDQLPVSTQEYSCPPGIRSRLLLPDSTQVWLNSDSRLSLSENFGYGVRSVSLSGEAFFEVSRKEDLPFIVTTSDIEIRVLGTSFNVSAYPDDKDVQAVLVAGEISVRHKAAVKKSELPLAMQPSQLLTVAKGSQALELKSNVNTSLYTAWMDNKLVFEDTPMEEVMHRLERWYNVRIALHGEELKRYAFTGTFDSRTLAQVLSYIAQSSPSFYSISEDYIVVEQRE